jgi:VanZ family protein
MISPLRASLRSRLPLLAVVVAAYWVAIFVATHLPTVPLPDIDNIDKVCHCVAYAGLAFAVGSFLAVWRGYQVRFPIWIWTLAVAYGAIDEFTQLWVPGRTADVFDLAADATGAAIGVALVQCCVLANRYWRPSLRTA